MEMVYGGGTGPQVSCGTGSKRLCHQLSICCLEFSTILVCLWAAGGKIGKEVKFQSSQISGLNRTLTEGCQKPGERSVTRASMLSFETENLCV